MPLSDAAIRTAKPTEKTQRLFDGQGMYLDCRPQVAEPDTTHAAAREKREAARRLRPRGPIGDR